MHSPTILVERDGGLTRLTLNRPDRLNSFNGEMLSAFKAALDAVDADTGCRAVLLTGAGRGFCAGQDLSDASVKPGDPNGDIGITLEQNYNPIVRKMHALSKPLVIAVNGVAAGGGASLSFHGDIVLAACSAKFVQAFAKIALIPDIGGTWGLTRLAGQARARGLAMLGDPISAEQAESWGLIWKAIDDDKLMAEATAVAQRLAAGPTAAFVAIRRALQAAESNTLDQQLELERNLQRDLGRMHDYAEGVAAFAAKRAPRFTGKA